MVARPQSASPTGDLRKAALVGKSLMRAAAYLQIPNRVLALIVGLSKSSITRLTQDSYRLEPGSKPFELALSVRAVCSVPSMPSLAGMR